MELFAIYAKQDILRQIVELALLAFLSLLQVQISFVVLAVLSVVIANFAALAQVVILVNTTLLEIIVNLAL